VAPSGETTTFPRLQFGSGLEAIRHAIETSEYGPLSFGITYPYSLNKDFRLINDYATVTGSGFAKKRSPNMGLQVGYEPAAMNSCGVTISQNCNLVLFEDEYNPLDAATDEILSIKYLAAGESCGQNTRMQFNVKVSMYKSGQDSGDVVDYNILFTGKQGASNVIGQITPVLNGIEQIAKFKWKDAFTKIAPSSHYYVTKIEIVDVATGSQIMRAQNSIFNIIGINAYSENMNTKLELTQETSYPYEIVTSILEKMEYVAWLDYGRERRLDVFCMAPEMNELSSVVAEQGVNVLGVTDKSYAPLDSVRNKKLSHYHYQEGDNDKTGISVVENLDSSARYGPGAREEYEDQTEINNLTDANIENTRFVEKNSYPMTSFTIVMPGTPLLNPSQYMVSKLYGDYLVGDYSTKTATHTINRDEGYVTRVGVNRPDSYYNLMMGKLEDKIEKYRQIQSKLMYSKNVLTNMGFNSIGAFIRSGY
jgi:hypothetical protein